MRIQLVLLLTLAVFVTSTLAQDHELEIWYWAQNRHPGDLFAYSVNGEINKLLTGVVEWIQPTWRVADNRAIALIRTSDQLALYSLDNETAQPLSIDIDALGLSFETLVEQGDGLRLEALNPPYMILTTWLPLNKTSSKPSLLINLSTNRIEVLSASVELANCCHFTQNGHQLRYVTIEGEYGAQTLELRELRLATNNEQAIYRRAGSNFNIQPDLSGERWLIHEEDNSRNFSQYRIFYTETGIDVKCDPVSGQ